MARLKLFLAFVATLVVSLSCDAPPKDSAGTEPVATLSQQIESASQTVGGQILADLPAGKTVAVLPLANSAGGVSRLGVLISQSLQGYLIRQGIKLVDRDHVAQLLEESDLIEAIGSDVERQKQFGGLARAEVLITGSVVDMGSEVIVSVKAIDASGGRQLAMSSGVSLKADDVGQLMWLVRRPADPKVGGELPPLAIQYDFQFDPVSPGQSSPGGSLVASGQRFKIRVMPNSDCYLYVLLYNSQGRAVSLFPHTDVGMSNRIAGDAWCDIPEGSRRYQFDNNPGMETFYIVASYTPIGNLDEILSAMAKGGDSGQLSQRARESIDRETTKGMSADTSREYQPAGFTIAPKGVTVSSGHGEKSDVGNLVQGYATLVRKIAFEHR